jgi:ADP-heptose:LPS heptosyltransferase
MSQRIVIVRALPGLGDLLCIVPACRALRAALPSAHVTLVGLPWAESFVARFARYFDALLEFPGYPGIAERPPAVAELPPFLTAAQARRFDLALQMHGSGTTSNPFTVLLGARHTAGFFVPGQYCPDGARFLPYVPEESEVQRYLRLLGHLGIPAQGEELEFPVSAEDRSELRRVDEARALQPGTYVCLHPGAKDVARRWPPEYFAATADALARQGLQVVLTGTAAEAGVTRAVARAMRAPVIDLAGRTNLGALAALLQGARLLICNDTGVSHLAAALRLPSVVVFITSDPARWAPLDRGLHRIVDYGKRPAGAGQKGRTTHARSFRASGAATVPAGDVLVEAQNLLRIR